MASKGAEAVVVDVDPLYWVSWVAVHFVVLHDSLVVAVAEECLARDPDSLVVVAEYVVAVKFD